MKHRKLSIFFVFYFFCTLLFASDKLNEEFIAGKDTPIGIDKQWKKTALNPSLM